jgi:hypothetical protein
MFLLASHLWKGEGLMADQTGVRLRLALLRGDQVLLGERRNTGYADGWWHLPAGGLEAGESVTAGMAREAKCAQLRRWTIGALAARIVGYTAAVLGQITAGRPLSVIGWPA